MGLQWCLQLLIGCHKKVWKAYGKTKMITWDNSTKTHTNELVIILKKIMGLQWCLQLLAGCTKSYEKLMKRFGWKCKILASENRK